MRTSEPILFDSNILVYAHNEDSLFHSQSINLITEVIKGGISGVLTSQNLLEFYSIITDKRRLSNPITPKVASELIKQYLASPFEIIYPNLNTNKIMLELLKKNNPKDGQIFNCYLIATMLSNNIGQLITANIADFEKIDSISALDLKTYFQLINPYSLDPELKLC